MIKSEKKDFGKYNISFPKLMEGNLTGSVVLFTSTKEGILLKGQSDNVDLYSNYDGWNIECFSDFNGELILTNEKEGN